MTNDFWNSRFSEPGYAYGTEPNAFLVSQKHYFDARPQDARGRGRRGAQRRVAGAAGSRRAVDGRFGSGARKAQELAKSRGVSIRTEVADLARWRWPEHEFDIVAAIFIHFMPEFRARMHAKMLRALKPGGVLIMEAFTPEQLRYKTGGPPVKEML